MLTARRLYDNRREIIGVRSSIYCKKEKRHLFDVVFSDNRRIKLRLSVSLINAPQDFYAHGSPLARQPP